MNPAGDLQRRLVEVDDSLLAVIDIQDSFLDKYPPQQSRDLVERVTWLLCVAELLRVPVVAMAEDIGRAGGLHAAVAAALPSSAPVFDKNAFGLADNPEILAAVEATGRRTAVLVGVETDVCVAHSALGLLGRGYRVAVPRDAVLTTAGDAETGLERMRGAGTLITSVKALYYEWLRTVEAAVKLAREHPELEGERRPASLQL